MTLSFSQQIVHEMGMQAWDTRSSSAAGTPSNANADSSGDCARASSEDFEEQQATFVTLRAQLRAERQEKMQALALVR
jgi:hypothetical protein